MESSSIRRNPWFRWSQMRATKSGSSARGQSRKPEKVAPKTSVRTCEVPTRDFEGQSYHEVIELAVVRFTEPPLTERTSSKDIEAYIRSNYGRKGNPKLPLSYTASRDWCDWKHASGDDARDKYIWANLKSWRDIPHFGSKQDYV